jgi:hypothetical protein
VGRFVRPIQIFEGVPEMNARTTPMEVRALRRTREQIAAMLSRYPNVSPEESDAIVEFLRKGRHIDVGMLTADETLKPNVDAFMNDHKAELGVKLWEAAALIGGIAAFLVIAWLVWEAFS